MPFAARRTHALARLRALALGGTASIAAGVIATNVLRILSSMTLTRLLDSAAYGVVGVITSIAYMLSMVSDIGLIPFIIRHEQVDEQRFLDEVWALKLARGIGLSLLMLVIAHPAARFLGKPELAAVIMVWGTMFTIDGLSALTFATAIREQKLWRLSMVDLASNVVTLIGSVLSALALHSYWAMIIGMLFGQVARAILSYTLFPGSSRRFVFNRARSRELWGYSRYIAASSVLSIAILQADKVALARLMPLAVYGFYAIATTLAVAPEAIAGPYTQRVLYPAYARIVREGRETLAQTFYAARRRVVLLYSLGVGGLIGAAPLVVAILYDPRYRPVALFLQLLAIRVLLRMPNLAANEAMLALGRTRAILVANVCRLIWLLAGGITALMLGQVMLLVAVVATDELPAMIWYWWNLRRYKMLDLAEEGYGFLAALAGAGLGAGAAWIGLHFVA